MKIALWVFAAFMVFGIGGMVATHKPWSADDAPRNLARSEYEWCVKQSKDETRSPQVRLELAGECLKLRQGFQEKYKQLP